MPGKLGQASCALRVLCLLSWAIQWASSSPSCFYPTAPSGQLTYSCTGIRSSAELVDRFQPNRTAEGSLRLVFEDSVLEQIPPGLFNGLPVSALHFKNVVLTGRPSRTDPTPLRGLEGTLEKLVFSHNSTVPENWASFLVGMSALTEMVFFHMSGLSFASGVHSGLPSSLRKLHLVSSSIESADDYWLSSLVNLETLLLRHVILSTFPRTVLPTTAGKLQTLLLEGCSLTAFPTGLDKGLPSLKYVSLQNNQIVGVGTEDLASLANKGVVVELKGNPLDCDCPLLQFLARNPGRHSVYGQCKTPASHDGRNLRTISRRDLMSC